MRWCHKKAVDEINLKKKCVDPGIHFEIVDWALNLKKYLSNGKINWMQSAYVELQIFDLKVELIVGLSFYFWFLRIIRISALCQLLRKMSIRLKPHLIGNLVDFLRFHEVHWHRFIARSVDSKGIIKRVKTSRVEDKKPSKTFIYSCNTQENT